MANQTIPNLPAATAIDGTEQLWAVQSGADVRVTTTQIANLVTGGSSVIGVPAGGTGDSTFTQYGVLIGNAGDPLLATGAGTTGQFLQANSGGVPTWVTVVPGVGVTELSFGTTGLTPATLTTGPITVGGTLGVANGGTGNVTLTANAVLVGNGTSATLDTGAGSVGEILIGKTGAAPAWLAAGTTGQILSANTGGDPSWVALPGTGVATISFGTTGLTPSSATNGVVTVAGTLVGANGGTGLTTFTAADNALYSTSSSALTAGTLPSAAGGTGLTTFTAANNALYSTSSSALTAGTLPVAAGGTGATAATGTGNVVLATSPTLTTPIVTALNGGSLAGMRNRIINGNMRIDQRNSGAAQTFTASAALAYCVDRFYGYCTGANVTGQQIASAGASTSPSFNAYRFTGAASVTGIGFAQRIEAQNSFDLAGASATISVTLSNSLLTSVTWALAYANTADTFGTLASPTVTAISSGVWTISSSATVYTATVSIPSAATTGLQLTLTVGAQTSGTWTIGNVQIEPGTQATPFERRPVGFEIEQCQRYTPVISCSGISTGTLCIGSCFSTSVGWLFYNFQTKPRTPPTGITVYNVGSFALGSIAGVTTAVTSITFGSATNDIGYINVTGTGTPYTVNNFAFLNVGSSNGLVVFTGSEL